MSTVTVEEAQLNLVQILAELKPGEQLAILTGGEEVARLTRSAQKTWPCKAGSYRKEEFRMSPDFDAPLDEFKEYME